MNSPHARDRLFAESVQHRVTWIPTSRAACDSLIFFCLPTGPRAGAVTAVAGPRAGPVRGVVARARSGELDVLGAVDVERGVDDRVVPVDDGLVARGARPH